MKGGSPETVLGPCSNVHIFMMGLLIIIITIFSSLHFAFCACTLSRRQLLLQLQLQLLLAAASVPVFNLSVCAPPFPCHVNYIILTNQESRISWCQIPNQHGPHSEQVTGKVKWYSTFGEVEKVLTEFAHCLGSTLEPSPL